MAKSFSIYEAKARLSELLREVKKGKDIVVLERGIPIAKIVPFKIDETLQERVATLKRSGNLLTQCSEASPWPLGPKKNKGALKRFLEERE